MNSCQLKASPVGQDDEGTIAYSLCHRSVQQTRSRGMSKRHGSVRQSGACLRLVVVLRLSAGIRSIVCSLYYGITRGMGVSCSVYYIAS